MFFWQSNATESKPTARKRSIPVPLKASEHSTDFKNSVGPITSDPDSKALPTFSRSDSDKSVLRLRKLVDSNLSSSGGSSDQDKTNDTTSVPDKWAWFKRKPDVSKSDNTGKDSAPTKNGAGASNKSQEVSEPQEPIVDEDRTQKETSYQTSNGSAWAFWSKQSDTRGEVAIAGSNTEHHPRKADIPEPDTKESTSKKRRKANKSVVVPGFSSIKKRSRASLFTNFLWNNEILPMVQQSPSKPRRAVIVGVHGYFPARMTRAILGEPTGTSLKFANEAEARLKTWFNANFPQDGELSIDKIALEGEGRIASRISTLYDLLMNWQQLLVQADIIIFAAHSQGAVVTASIVDRLLDESFLNLKRQKVTVLAMAGSWLGPMPGMDQTLVMKAITRIENDSLLELFELQNTNSNVSQHLQASLANILNQGVKIVLVGSCNDQLIPLYSALALNVQHPNLFRAAYVDGEEVRPEVVVPLLHLSLQQLNQGNTDHGVIKELSSILAGSLTSGGHSKLYNHDEVYDLALNLTFMATTSTSVDPEFTDTFKIPKHSAGNPYVLPWAARALVTDCQLSKDLASIVNELLDQFSIWKPETKQMKDLKWRLAGLSSSKL